jgi:hypothetical protein
VLSVLEEDDCTDHGAVNPGEARDVNFQGLAERREGEVHPKLIEVLVGKAMNQDRRNELHVGRDAVGFLLANKADRGPVQEEKLVLDSDRAVLWERNLAYMSPRDEGTIVT